jgi:formamidopyrimidine-DNA glycosylase
LSRNPAGFLLPEIMPELPEVEQAARTLRAWLTGLPIVRVEAPASRIFRGGDRAAFLEALPGRSLARVERRGKILLLAFDGDVGLLSHLGMTGRWSRRAAGEPAPPHSRARLELGDGSAVHYGDPRMFGRLAVHRAAELPALPEVVALGPDPLVDGIDPARLRAAFARTARAVKPALLDQAILAGVGNIYATEALFRARVHPAREARSLKVREVARLAEGILGAFADALARVDGEAQYLWSGERAENPYAVYDRAGEPCPRCSRAIEALTLGGRTSAYCPRCQK